MEKDKEKGRVVIKYQDSSSYIKNPMSMVERLGAFSLPAQKVMFEILSSIQPNINKFLELRKKYGPEQVRNINIETDLDVKGFISWQIPMKTLCKHTADYNAIRTAAVALSSMLVEIDFLNDNNVLTHAVRQLIRVDVPTSVDKGKRAAGHVDISIEDNVFYTIFNMDKGGYSEHIKGIVNIAKGKYTVALYTLLNKYFSQEKYDGECVLTYSDLRQNLKVDEKVLVPVSGGKEGEYVKVMERKYVQYRDFKKRVLDTAKAELKKLWDENKGVDFWFDYEEIKVDGVRTSTNGPKAIRFIMRNERKQVVVDEKPKDKKEVVAARALFYKFSTPCQNVVGVDVYNMWWNTLRLAERYDNGAVIVYFEQRSTYDMWKEKIYEPCKEEWVKIFGDVEPIYREFPTY